MTNAGVDNKKTKDNYLFSLSVNVVYSGAFTGTVIVTVICKALSWCDSHESQAYISADCSHA